MRRAIVGFVSASLLLLALAGSAAAVARTPFHVTFSEVVGFTPPMEWGSGAAYHATGMELDIYQETDVPELNGVLEIHVNYVFAGPAGDNAWGWETLASSTYPGEGFTCTLHGQWLRDGTRHMYDHCFGYGDHLTGWRFATEAVAIDNVDIAFSGEVWTVGR